MDKENWQSQAFVSTCQALDKENWQSLEVCHLSSWPGHRVSLDNWAEDKTRASCPHFYLAKHNIDKEACKQINKLRHFKGVLFLTNAKLQCFYSLLNFVLTAMVTFKELKYPNRMVSENHCVLVLPQILQWG